MGAHLREVLTCFLTNPLSLNLILMYLYVMELQSPSNPATDISSQSVREFSRAREIACLRRLLEKRNLSLSLDKFPELIQEGDIFEVYDTRGQQIYRSWSFFRHCSYNAVDLVVYDWHELFVRPKWIERHLRGLLPFFFRPHAGILKYDVPEHLIYERYGDPSRVSLLKMKYASTLVDTSTREPRAFITTSRIRELGTEFRDGVIPMI